MSFTFLLAIVFGLAALALFAVSVASRQRTGRRVSLLPALLVAGLALLLLFLSCTKVITAAVGVPVTLGSVGEPMQPGFHFKSPITNVVTYPIRNSDTVCLGDRGDETPGIVVKTAQQGSLTTRPCLSYRIDPEEASKIYLIARDADKLRDSVVLPLASQGVTAAFAKLTNDEAIATKLPELPDLVRTEVAKALEAQGIEVVTLTVPAPVASENLQKFVDAKLAETQRAEQAVIAQERARIESQTDINQAVAQAEVARLASAATPASLCQDFINMLAQKDNIGVILADPCGGGAARPGINVNVP